MKVTIPPSDTEKNIESIKRAVERKRSEVAKARDAYTNLQAELRGLEEAIDVLSSYRPKVEG